MTLSGIYWFISTTEAATAKLIYDLYMKKKLHAQCSKRIIVSKLDEMKSHLFQYLLMLYHGIFYFNANLLISVAIKLSYLTGIVILQGHRVMFREPYFFLWEEVALGAICVFVLEIRENQPEIGYNFSLKSTYSVRTSSTDICHLLL